MRKNTPWRREYDLNRYHQRRAEMFRILGGKCKSCGVTEDLQVDHIDPKKKEIDVAKLWTVNWNRMLTELEKCQLLCGPCHREKTIIDRGFKVAKGTHGTLSSRAYCDCPLCVKAKTDYMREYKRRKRRERGVKERKKRI